LHPYTQGLLAAVPVPDPVVESQREHKIVTGEIPSPMNPPSGCVFHPRCPLAQESCSRDLPVLREIKPGHWVACPVV
jgi:oligopeptide/dipeptide ABC transporter ATP-binding protein